MIKRAAPRHQQPTPSLRRHQSGVALISMLLIFTIVAVMCSDIALRLYLDIRRTTYFLDDSQARQYALGGEALARQLLAQDFADDLKSPPANNVGNKGESNSGNDHLQENWSNTPQFFETDGGDIQLYIEDLNSRFNINSLVTAEGVINTQQLQLYQRLLADLTLPVELGLNLADWLDRDSTPNGISTEDQYYLGLETAYRSANRPLTSTSELAAVKGYSQEVLASLLPYITALPAHTSRININTASTTVLNSLHPNMPGEQVVGARENLERGFESLSAFYTNATVAVPADLNENLITVRSQYFRVWVKARFHERDIYLRSHLYREPTSGQLALLHRSLAPPGSSGWASELLFNPFYQAEPHHDS